MNDGSLWTALWSHFSRAPLFMYPMGLFWSEKILSWFFTKSCCLFAYFRVLKYFVRFVSAFFQDPEFVLKKFGQGKHQYFLSRLFISFEIFVFRQAFFRVHPHNVHLCVFTTREVFALFLIKTVFSEWDCLAPSFLEHFGRGSILHQAAVIIEGRFSAILSIHVPGFWLDTQWIYESCVEVDGLQCVMIFFIFQVVVCFGLKQMCDWPYRR